MDLSHWLNVDHDERDQEWERAFLAALPMAQVRIANPEPQEGPDHWPYLLIETDDDGLASSPDRSSGDARIDPSGAGGINGASLVASSGEALEPLINILHWLSGRGIGLALNTMKPLPDFVFTYGMIWNFKERGEFFTTPTADPKSESPGIKAPEVAGAKAPTQGRFEIKDGQEVWAGPPSEAYLPKYVRSVIKQFFMDQSVFAPKVLMVSVDQKNYDLCFSLESLKSPPAHEHANIAEALAWFLPAHYSVSLLSEKAVAGFVTL